MSKKGYGIKKQTVFHIRCKETGDMFELTDYHEAMRKVDTKKFSFVSAKTWAKGKPLQATG